MNVTLHTCLCECTTPNRYLSFITLHMHSNKFMINFCWILPLACNNHIAPSSSKFVCSFMVAVIFLRHIRMRPILRLFLLLQEVLHNACSFVFRKFQYRSSYTELYFTFHITQVKFGVNTVSLDRQVTTSE